jgi:hypothetical protein
MIPMAVAPLILIPIARAGVDDELLLGTIGYLPEEIPILQIGAG